MPHTPPIRRGLLPLSLLTGLLLLSAPATVGQDDGPSVAQRQLSGCSGKARFLSPHTQPATQPTGVGIDVSYYKLDLDISTPPPFIRGRVTLKARCVADSLSTLLLDLDEAMRIDSAVQNGSRRSFLQFPAVLSISLDRTYRSGEDLVIDIFYGGLPSASGFGSFVFSSHAGQPWIWSLSQPYGARDWWPCKDHPSDKADSVDVWVTCESGLKVGSNGRLVGVRDNGNGTRTHMWSERYPIATYLVSVALTNFAEFSNWFRYSPTDSMQILNYVLPERLAAAQTLLPKTVDMLRIFSELFGPYPFLSEKYGHSEFGAGGAMEHQTMTSTTTFDEDAIAHELAHQWFGDLITCVSWPHLWLNEGFATYCEALYFEQMSGSADYRRVMEGILSRALGATGTLYVQDTVSVRNLFDDARVYSKGAAVLHMLRHILGDSTFIAAVKQYVGNPDLRYASASTEDFQNSCETVSGAQLSSFFRQWVYGEGFPTYSFQWTADSLNSGYSVTVRIDQSTGTANPPFFEMPIDVRLSAGSWDTTVVLHHQYSGQIFTVNVARRPERARLDPDHWILRELLPEDVSVPSSFSLEQNYPNPFNAGTVIRFRVPRRTTVTMKVFDILGRDIATVTEDRYDPGTHSVTWNGTTAGGAPAASGVYFYRVDADGFSSTQRMMILR